jgi:hypothetical protein
MTRQQVPCPQRHYADNGNPYLQGLLHLTLADFMPFVGLVSVEAAAAALFTAHTIVEGGSTCRELQGVSMTQKHSMQYIRMASRIMTICRFCQIVVRPIAVAAIPKRMVQKTSSDIVAADVAIENLCD